jgi:hypothetical protein
MALPASATNGGTGGQGGGSGSASGSGYWTGSWSDGGGSAWQKFTNGGQWNNTQNVRNAGGDVLIGHCQNSQAIWWYAQNGGTNFYAGFHGTRTLNDNADQVRRVGHGIPDSWGDIAADWTNPDIRKRTDNPYIIICSAAIGLYPEENRANTRNWSETEVVTTSERLPMSYTSQVSEQYKPDINTFEFTPQVAATTTAFGRLHAQVSANPNSYTPESLRGAIDQAKTEDAGLVLPTITLTEANQTAFANSMVINFDRRRTMGALSAERTTVVSYTQSCESKRTWNYQGQHWNAWEENCGPRTETGRTSTNAVNVGTPTPETIQFYQLLSVHCNPEQLAALLASSDQLSLVDSTPNSAVVTTAPVDRAVNAHERLLGNALNTVEAQRVTATNEFYNQQCPWECIASPRTQDGASAANGATTNVRATGDLIPDTRYGAVYAERNGNSFGMFRDGEPRPVAVDVWYPRTADGFIYSGAAPQKTSVTLWAQGTPLAGEVASGGRFALHVNNADIFAGAKSGTTSATVNGLARTFGAAGTWASEADRPQVASVTWEYRPQLEVRIPTVIGGTLSGEAIIGTPTVKLVTVVGICVAQFGTETGYRNTTINGTTPPAVTVSNPETPHTDPANLVLNFVRATAG